MKFSMGLLKPDLHGLPEFGTKVWVHTPEGSKLDGRSVIGRWVGFDVAIALMPLKPELSQFNAQ